MGKGKWKPSPFTLLANEEKELFNDALVEAKYLRGKVLHPRYELNERQKEKGFFAFIDFENVFYSVGDKYEFYPLKNLIEKALKKLDKDYTLEEVIGYGNIEKFSHHQFANLCKNGSIIKHIPERSVYCTNCRPEDVDRFERPKDYADKLIVESMMLFDLDVPSSHILVITGDSDFATPVAVLKSQGQYVLTAVQDDNTKEELVNSGDASYSSTQLFTGFLVKPRPKQR